MRVFMIWLQCTTTFNLELADHIEPLYILILVHFVVLPRRL